MAASTLKLAYYSLFRNTEQWCLFVRLVFFLGGGYVTGRDPSPMMLDICTMCLVTEWLILLLPASWRM